MGEIIRRLQAQYPHAECSLTYRNPFELLVATILSAQCTDERVNKVTPALFLKYPDANHLARAPQADVERLVQSTGFFRNKAKNLIAMAQRLHEKFGGQVPETMEELSALPGVGRKTANVVMGNAFGVAAGVVVDTHVKRLAFRLGLTKHTQPERIEQDLNKLVPPESWVELPHLLIQHGRNVCDARKPECSQCVLAELCPQKGVRLKTRLKAVSTAKKTKGVKNR